MRLSTISDLANTLTSVQNGRQNAGDISVIPFCLSLNFTELCFNGMIVAWHRTDNKIGTWTNGDPVHKCMSTLLYELSHFPLETDWIMVQIMTQFTDTYLILLYGISHYPTGWIKYFESHWKKRFCNTLGPRQNGQHFPDDIFKAIFLNENVWILIKIALKSVPH